MRPTPGLQKRKSLDRLMEIRLTSPPGPAEWNTPKGTPAKPRSPNVGVLRRSCDRLPMRECFSMPIGSKAAGAHRSAPSSYIRQNLFFEEPADQDECVIEYDDDDMDMEVDDFELDCAEFTALGAKGDGEAMMVDFVVGVAKAAFVQLSGTGQTTAIPANS